MLKFLKNYGGTILVALVILGIVALSVYQMLKTKKSGTLPCGAYTKNCPIKKIIKRRKAK